MNVKICFLHLSRYVCVLLFLVSVTWNASANARGDSGRTDALGRFADAVRSGEVSTVSIPSAAKCQCIAEDREREKALEARERGREILKCLQESRQSGAGNPFILAEDALTLRSWCLATPGYGNLVLACAAEETAVLSLLAVLDDPGCNREAVGHLRERCAGETAPLDYWLRTLAIEGKNVDVAKIGSLDDEESRRLVLLCQWLWDENAARCGWGSVLGGGGGYETCYDGFNPAQVGWLALSISIRKAALDACLAVRDAVGRIPENRAEFLEAVKLHADDILRREDRLGGRMYADQVWIAWNEAREARETVTAAGETEGAAK